MTPEKAKNIYWGASPLPEGAKSLGEYVGDDGLFKGCLIELASGIRVVGNAGAIKNIPQRGGRRPGAGRPELPEEKKKVAVSVLLPPDLLTWMDNRPESRAALIEEACRAYYKIPLAG
jgi:hypothetical protein